MDRGAVVIAAPVRPPSDPAAMRERLPTVSTPIDDAFTAGGRLRIAPWSRSWENLRSR